ncbi:hypothetical protein XH80_04895 [Bradyrhizobium sp. CCBAU 45384]|nr:hypothetical protein [Bradyrhizobium sp. CCBAU 45384]
MVLVRGLIGLPAAPALRAGALQNRWVVTHPLGQGVDRHTCVEQGWGVDNSPERSSGDAMGVADTEMAANMRAASGRPIMDRSTSVS